MDNCPKCNCRLTLANGRIQFEGDESPDTPTKAYQIQNRVCTNENCDMYGGGKDKDKKPLPLDLSNPVIVVEVLKQPLN